jgi:hypothetical protein
MKAFVESGLVIDLALLVIALEVVVLLVLRRRTARGLRPLDVLGQLLAGALLLLGIRCAVTGADHRWTLLCLSASFPAHAFDLARRARQQGSTT